MMRTSNRQDGAVNIMFFIIALVIALAGWGLWYTAWKEAELQREAAEAARRETTENLETVTAYKFAMDDLTGVLGFGDIPEPQPGETQEEYRNTQIKPRLQQMRTLVDQARALFEGDESMRTIKNVLDPAQAKILGLENQIASLKRDIEAARGDIAAAKQANDQMITAQAETIRTMQSEHSQAVDRYVGQLGQADEKYRALQADFDSASAELASTLESSRRQLQEAGDTVAALEQDVRQIKATERHERVRNAPDGAVIGVDAERGLCTIDLGVKHQLRRGTRFMTYGVKKGGVREMHGYITVRDIETSRAICTIDPGASPVRGDLITNPYFDRDRRQVFYFLGKLPGLYDNQRAASILRDFGATIAEDMSVEVDFLVLGANPDPDAVGEDADPNWFKSTEAYADAVRWGIEMLPARDLEEFLRY